MKTQARLDENKRQALVILDKIVGAFLYFIAGLLVILYFVTALSVIFGMAYTMFGGGE